MSKVVTLERSVRRLTSETGISGNPLTQSLELGWLSEKRKGASILLTAITQLL